MNRLAGWARRFGAARAACVVLLAALVALRVWDPRPVEELRLRAFDLLQVLHPRQQSGHPVVIVDIDEQSLREIGQWPWPRTTIADLITRIHALGAVAVGLDMVFAEPDRMSPGAIAASIRGIDPQTRAKLASLPSNDAVLAEAIRPANVVLGQAASAVPAPPQPATPSTGVAIIGPDPSRYLDHYPTLLRNVPDLEAAAAGRGVFTAIEEQDGIVRRAPAIMEAAGRIVPSLTTEILRVLAGADSIVVRADQGGIQRVSMRRLSVPTDFKGRVWIYFNHHDSARFIAAKDVLQNKVSADRLRGRVVLIGTSALGLLDSKTTALDPIVPGVEVHAQILENVLGDTMLSNPDWAVVVELLIAVLVGLSVIIAAPLLSAAAVIALGAGIMVAVIGLSGYLFVAHRVLLDFTYPLLSIWLIYLVLAFVNYFREQQQRRQIRSAFGFYLSPPLVEQLARAPEKLTLGGEQRHLTILFADVRGFTAIAEQYKDDPQGLTRLMNRLLTPLTDAIIARNGTIDKYIGDAIMAFWNAPLDDDRQETNACEAALDMQARAAALNAALEREAEAGGGNYLPLRIGIGLNTGPCVVGNMGSDFRFNYSVLGDTVNVASRLEARTKDYRLPLVIGARTAERAGEKFATMEIDLIKVAGKSEPEAVFTILGRRTELEHDPRCAALRALNADMLARYRKQDWDQALALIERCRAIAHGFDLAGLYDMYAERIAAHRADPPPPGWDGAYAAASK